MSVNLGLAENAAWKMILAISKPLMPCDVAVLGPSMWPFRRLFAANVTPNMTHTKKRTIAARPGRKEDDSMKDILGLLITMIPFIILAFFTGL
jgi:hypothetical protein